MSASTKKKYVEQEATYDLVLPEPPNFIGRILAGRGNNLHEIESENGEQFLVSMPTKFRKSVWVKRGDFVLCEPIVEGDKVRAEITRVLLKDNIKLV
uniref:Probable RNA-binding protein EIF1AD n=1 Tax=Romanomermis culicivorax TaxID=13658 RepID=A0A915HNC7_ROMCU